MLALINKGSGRVFELILLDDLSALVSFGYATSTLAPHHHAISLSRTSKNIELNYGTTVLLSILQIVFVTIETITTIIPYRKDLTTSITTSTKAKTTKPVNHA